MSKINVLEKHVAELIAAGEVVERPCSVVKELVENSIDAGATTITVEIQNGGNTFIRITDNGCGIGPEDLPKAFLRHATSKIKEEDDLEHIASFGFRGEALASIAAVSHTEIITRTKASLTGYRCVAEGGEIGEVEEAGCPFGTTIVVRDLFYNTPARQKFLKKDISEATAVSQVIDKMALSHPEIKVNFIKDGAHKLSTHGNGDLLVTISDVCGRDFANDLYAVDYSPMSQKGFHVSGYVTKPIASKSTHASQTFFVNGRYVKNRTASVALEEAYKGSSMVGKYPGCVLNIEVPPEFVDVNVHPAKTEVRFANEKDIFDLVYYGAKSVLSNQDRSVVLEASRKTNKDFWESLPKENEDVRKHFEEVVQQTSMPIVPKSSHIDLHYEVVDYRPEVLENKDNLTPYRIDDGITHSMQYKLHQMASQAVDEGKDIPKECQDSLESMKEIGAPLPVLPRAISDEDFPLGKLKYIGELFKTYILLESAEELIFVDKHAAHERILYENLKKGIKAFDCQVLLTPITCNLGEDQCAAVLENKEEVERFGFVVDDFGKGCVLVRSLPFWVKPDEAEGILGEISDSLVECKHDITPEKLDYLYANISCRAAIKANDNNSEFELEKIVNVLLNDPNIKYCPHGRPVSTSLSKSKLEKMFGRRV